MPTNIDDTLRALSRVDDHQALAGMEDRVLARLDAQRSEAVEMRMMFSLAVGALLIGAGSASLPFSSVAATATATTTEGASFARPGPLAPSSLLLRAGER